MQLQTLPRPASRLPARAPVRPGRPAGEQQRDLLHELVCCNPGLHIRRAAALLGLNWNTCLHHVRRLEGEGRITVRKVNGRVCLFDPREGAVSRHLAVLLLREGRNSDLARAVLETPGLNQKSLAIALGMAESVVHRRLLRFAEAGLVERVAQSRSVAVFATNALQALWPAPGLVPAEPAGPPVPAWPPVPDLVPFPAAGLDAPQPVLAASA